VPRRKGGADESRVIALTQAAGNARYEELDWSAAPTDTDTLSGALRYGLTFLRRNWLFLVFGLLLGLALMPAATLIAPPRFVASTTILDTGRVQFFQQPAALEAPDGLEDQLHIIKSSMLARQVLEKLGPIADEEFPIPKQGRAERLLGPKVAGWLGLVKQRSDAWHEQYRLSAFEAALDARRVPETRLISVSFEASTADRAATIANLVASTYLKAQVSDKESLNRRASDWLADRLDELKTQAADAQGAVNTLRSSNTLLEGTGQQFTESRFTTLSTQLESERVRLAELQARLDLVEKVIKEYAKSDNKPALSELNKNELVTRLRGQLYELSNRRELLAQRFPTTHEAIVRLDRRIAEIHAAILDEYRRLAQAYRSDIEIARRKEHTLNETLQEVLAQLKETNEARINLRELESKAVATQGLYDGLLKRQTEASAQGSFPIPRQRIIDEAMAPLGKNYKKTTKMAVVLLLFGIAFGGGLAVLRDLNDQTFRSLKDVEESLGTLLLSVVPTWTQRFSFGRRRKHAPTPAQGETAGFIKRKAGIVWASDETPQSQFAESLRMVGHQIDARMLRRGEKVVGITSMAPGEGSSTLAAALAVTMAASGYRTLLIDCDLRNPTLSRMLTPTATKGLVDVLKGEADIKEVVQTDPGTELSFLPAPTAGGLRSDVLLGRDEMDKVISAARESFDCVIVDLASLVPLVDVMVASRFIDRYVSVVGWGISNKEATRRAYDHAPFFRGRLLGVVLNKVDMKRLHLYDYAAAQWFDERKFHKYLNVIEPL
jgi:succinoglycan biosynthesis transport protein ExoP